MYTNHNHRNLKNVLKDRNIVNSKCLEKNRQTKLDTAAGVWLRHRE